MMRLHVLGPAFGLPSIDPQCVAAVALVKKSLREGEWSLFATHEQSRRLPYLEHDGQYFEGFDNVVRCLSEKKELQRGSGDLDTEGNRLSTHITTHAQTRLSFYLDDDDEADDEADDGHDTASASPQARLATSTALSSFITTHAQTLLDISLYVSADNYASTRTAFTEILPWHANYILPPSRRKAARLRTDHLGVSSIDVDDVHEDLSNRPPSLARDVGKEAKEFEPETQKRASLLLGGKETLRSMLRRPEHSAVFKLHALADNFFGPLQDMLGGKKYLVGNEEPTAVDCLTYGYLSLMRFPDLPQDWLAKVLARKYGKLFEYLERLHTELNMATNVEDVMALARCKSAVEAIELRRAGGMTLPWEPPTQSSALDVGRTIATDLLSRMPLLYSPTTIIPSNHRSISQWRRYLPLAATLTATSLGLSLYWALSTGLLIWPHGEEVHIFGKKRFSDFGHLGAALAGVSLLGQQAGGDRAFHHQEQRERLGNVEVQVERDAR